MTISPKEAQAALNQVEDAETSLAVLKGYRHSSAHLILWGLVWMVCYVLSDFSPERIGLIWLIGDGLGIAGSTWLGMRSAGRYGRFDFRFLAEIAVLLLFAGAVAAIFQADDFRKTSALITLVFALWYMQIGIRHGVRIFLAGLLVAILTVGGFYLLKDHYLTWIGVTAGGTLIASGFWLRRA